MKNTMKIGTLLVLGLSLSVGGLSATAEAANKGAKVISSTRIATATYHGRRGNIYSSKKLTKVRYRLAKYKYTTWSATARAKVKKNGHKISLTYIKAGSKKGWVYSRDLTRGKAPVNRSKVVANDMSSVRSITISGSAELQNILNGYSSTRLVSYSNLASNLYSFYGFNNIYANEEPKNMVKDKTVLLDIYSLFKKRLPGSTTEKTDLGKMATKVKNEQIIGNGDDSAAQVSVFVDQLADLINKM